MSLLDVRNVRKVFSEEGKDIVAIENVSFSVGDDEFVCLVGPSGCGKSTMLRIISGLDHATEGKVLFQGQEVNSPSPKISMVFQLFGLLPWKTALENVTLPLEVVGMPKEERISLARDYLKQVQLEGFENTYPHDLSGGMKQRVGIARALALKPRILLMDEPFSSLDELTAKTLRDLTLRIWRKREEPPDSILMVSHNVEEAVYMADRVIVMSPRPGHVVADVKIDLPRPRQPQLRTQAYFSYVDKVMETLQNGKAGSCIGQGARS